MKFTISWLKEHLDTKYNDNKLIEKLTDVGLEAQCLLVNTLGGRVPYGYRFAGKDGDAVKRRIEDRVDRLLRRLKMVGDSLHQLM